MIDMTSRLSSTIAAAAVAAAVLVPSSAHAAADCQVVSTSTSSTDGASYAEGKRWFTLYRTVTATTQLCGDVYSTSIDLGPWMPKPGPGEPDNIAFARTKAEHLELVRLHLIVKKLERTVRKLQHSMRWS